MTPGLGPRRMLPIIAATCVLGGTLAAQQTPVFRGGVDLVQVDVSVLDNERRPIHGLTATDFRVFEDGVEQRISAFSERLARDPDLSAAAWTRRIPSDVRVNNAEDGRLLLLVLDDASTPVFAIGARGYAPSGPNPRIAVMNTARAIVERMGPSDMAAIIFTVKNKSEQEFTDDRSRLLAAIDGFMSPGDDVGGANYALAASTFREAARVLATVPNRRKALIYIGMQELMSIALDTYADFSEGRREMLTQDAMRWALRSNVTFYHINPFLMADLDPARGVAPPPDLFRAPPNRSVDPMHAPLTPITLASGGFSISQPGQLAGGIEQIFREVGSYYLLGYGKPAREYTDKLRNIEVKVNLPDVRVHARSGYFDDKPIKAGKSGPSPLHTAITGLLPANDIAMRVNIAPFAIPGKKEAALMIVVGLRQPLSVAGELIRESVNRLTRAYTPEGDYKKGVNDFVTLDLRSTAGEVKYELLSRLDLKPGRYHLRLSAASRAFSKSGSVYDDLEIPDFWKLPLSLSGVVLNAEPALTSGPMSILKGVLPFAPTTQREFDGHKARGFFRVYQGGDRALEPVSLDMRIIDASDSTVHRTSEKLDVDRFGGRARTADVTFDLPLKDLPSGPFVLRVDAKCGEASTRRDVRFWIR